MKLTLRLTDHRGSLFVAKLATIAVLLSACGSSGDRAKAGGSSTGSASPSTSTASHCVATATASAHAGMAPIRAEPPGPLNTSSITGKKFALISYARKNNVVELTNAIGLQQALTVVGATLVNFDGQGTPDVVAQDIRSAIAQHTAGIVDDGWPPSLVLAPVAAAKAANIPVVFSGAEPTAPLSPGVVANLGDNSFQEGVLQADYALAHTNCSLHAVAIYTSAGSGNTDTVTGAEGEIKKLCSTDCSLVRVNVDPATFTTAEAGQVETTLQRSPDINYVLSAADLFVPYAIQGLKAVGRHIPIIGDQGVGLAAAQGGNGEVADVQQLPGAIWGYYMADSIMRAVTGVPRNEALPVRLLDSSNWGKSADLNAQFPNYVSIQDAFKRAWGR
ncbi:MAG: substrate-binding domain-containing protein [Solirubrobacterales bacterium]|nr:substrate-binding domain-containing protein [Solirubrobacterales bacterium]